MATPIVQRNKLIRFAPAGGWQSGKGIHCSVQVRAGMAGVFVWLFLFGPGCTPFRPLKIESVEHTRLYDSLYPYYVEVCALSRIRPIEGSRVSVQGTRSCI